MGNICLPGAVVPDHELMLSSVQVIQDVTEGGPVAEYLGYAFPVFYVFWCKRDRPARLGVREPGHAGRALHRRDKRDAHGPTFAVVVLYLGAESEHLLDIGKLIDVDDAVAARNP